MARVGLSEEQGIAMGSIRWLAVFVAFLVSGLFAMAEDVVRFDFETGDLQGWMVVEGHFDRIVSDRATYHNGGPYASKQGKYYLSTVEQQPGKPSNDRMTGVVESPVFLLSGPEMSFLVGGGDYPMTYVALCTLDGKEVRQARGRRTEVMARVHWNTPELVGKKVFLRVVDRETGGWGHITLDDFQAQGQIDQETTRQRFASLQRRIAENRYRELRRKYHFSALREAIADLSQTFAHRYPCAREFLTQTDTMEKQLRAAEKALDGQAIPVLARDLENLWRTVLGANPLVSGQPILYVVRPPYQSHYHAIDTLFHTEEFNPDRGCLHSALFQGGGAIKTIDLAHGNRVKTLLDVPQGIARDPEVHFSGNTIVFSLRRNSAEDYKIWEMSVEGTGLKQLTSAPGVSDVDPLYLPDDRIVFTSTREPKYNMCSRDHGANLFRMEADGANIHQIGKNNLFDNQPSLMPDGRILYARWEYVDRNFGDAHGLWTVNPDGTNQALYWKNNTASPGAVFAARMIPGTQQVLCIFGPHHDHLWGAMAMIDRRLGLDGRGPVVRIWPPGAIDLIHTGGSFDCDSFSSVEPKYTDPYPLSDKYFLCSRTTSSGGPMGIFLVDIFGNEILLHAEGPGCYDAMPLGPRPRPPVLPPRLRLRKRGRHLLCGGCLPRHPHAGSPARLGEGPSCRGVAREAALVAWSLVWPGIYGSGDELAQLGKQTHPGHRPG